MLNKVLAITVFGLSSTLAHAATIYTFCATDGWFPLSRGKEFAAISECFETNHILGSSVAEAYAESYCEKDWGADLGLFGVEAEQRLSNHFQTSRDCEAQRDRVQSAYSKQAPTSESFLIRDIRTIRFIR